MILAKMLLGRGEEGEKKERKGEERKGKDSQGEIRKDVRRSRRTQPPKKISFFICFQAIRINKVYRVVSIYPIKFF